MESDEELHAHPSGEYVLEALQSGVGVDEVVSNLLKLFLVRSTPQRVLAYRRYREQIGSYWVCESLERFHWLHLYRLVPLDVNFRRGINAVHPAARRVVDAALRLIRVSLCAHLEVAEDLVPVSELSKFFRAHQFWACLPLRYPTVAVSHDSVTAPLVKLYRRNFYGEVLPETALACIADTERSGESRAEELAAAGQCIVLPRQASLACIVAAYAMLKCEELYGSLCWSFSVLTSTQRVWKDCQPLLDFYFWVMYGSWSCCQHCGSHFFNDKYFREVVYKAERSSGSDMLSAVRRVVPSDAAEHSGSPPGVSSRWWYLPGMYRPVQHCGRCTVPPRTSGTFLSRVLRRPRQEASSGSAPRVSTSQLYRVPRVRPSGAGWSAWSAECITWPRFEHGGFSLGHVSGESMLEMSKEDS